MRRRSVAHLLIAALAAVIALTPALGAGDVPHVVFLVGEGEYRSEETMPALAERLETTWGWRTTRGASSTSRGSDASRGSSRTSTRRWSGCRARAPTAWRS